MNYSFENPLWLRYIKTPRGSTKPVKLDAIMEQRLQAFLRAKKVRSRLRHMKKTSK